MKPSCSSTFRTDSFRRDVGTSTRSWPARMPLRRRVNRSLSESLVFIASPRSLQDARDVPHVGVLTETDAAEAELPEHAPGRPQTRQRRTVRVMNFGFLAALIRIARVAIDSSVLSLTWRTACRARSSSVLRPVVPAGRRHDRHVQTLRTCRSSHSRSREDEVVAHAERVVAAAVERLARHARGSRARAAARC